MQTTMGEGDRKTADALKAAHLYYLQDRTMDAIAYEMQTSRSSISRLISYARDRGLVQIRLRSPLDQISSLQRRIRHDHGVMAHIAPIPDSTSDVDRLDRVAVSAARLLGQFFESNMIMGIGWGSTISAVSRHLPGKETHNSQVVQLNGAGNTRTTGIAYASEILGRFGRAFDAQVQQLPVPAFFDDPRTREAMWRERSTIRILDIQESMDVALFGIGSPFSDLPSRVYSGGYLDEDDVETLAAHGVVGDIATIFYREDGTYNDIPLNDRSSGPELAAIRRTPRRVCVVSGASKIAGLRGALAAGLISDLIIDETTARALVVDDSSPSE